MASQKIIQVQKDKSVEISVRRDRAEASRVRFSYDDGTLVPDQWLLLSDGWPRQGIVESVQHPKLARTPSHGSLCVNVLIYHMAILPV